MSKVMLPYLEPMYSTYHYLAGPGIAVKQNNTSDNWYYNNAVDWICSRKFLNGFTGLEMTLTCGAVWNTPILDQVYTNIRLVRRCVLDIIKTMIDDGFYVFYNGVDAYYIKGKCWYKERHIYHEGVIIGYDDEKNTLILAGYNQRWIFTIFETPQECFKESVVISCENVSYGTLWGYKVKNEHFELDVYSICNSLKKYLSSNTNDYPLNKYDEVLGIIVYDFICMYLDRLTDGSIPHDRRDRRVFRLVWEHKKCMLGRIKAIERLYSWNNELSSAYEEVVHLADKARFIYSKFVIKYSHSHLEKIQVILMQMKTLETKLLGNFINELEGKLNAEQ